MGGLNETNDLNFTDVLLPADAVIGEVGNGWRQLMTGLNFERLIVAAQGIGTHTDYRHPIETFAATISMVVALHFYSTA
jgi:hypothetical protein